MEQKIGFIGLGNMGGAILQGILASELIPASQFYLYDNHLANLESFKASYPEIVIEESGKQVAHEADIVFLAVKPKNIPDVLLDIQKELKQSTVVVSMAAGVTIKKIEALIGYEQKIIRVMPNTPALVNSGMTSLTANTEVSPEELELVQQIFNCIGQSAVVTEDLIHSVIGVSGSAPAYVFMFIEALADGAVKAGMTRKQAYLFAAQTVMGSAKLMLETHRHPGDLKDMVCSPAGTTIAGVQQLEENGFRAAVMKAVDASIQRSRELEAEK